MENKILDVEVSFTHGTTVFHIQNDTLQQFIEKLETAYETNKMVWFGSEYDDDQSIIVNPKQIVNVIIMKQKDKE